MKPRRVLIAIGVLVVIVLGALLWLGDNLNALVQKGVERYGPRVTETRVRLAGADIALRDGRGTLRGLHVANPDGFSNDDAISLGEITLDIDLGSVTDSPIVIETLLVEGPSLLLEVAENGDVNLRTLQKSVNEYASRSADGADDSPPPRIAVKEFTLQGGTLKLDTTAIGGERTERTLDGFTLRDIGGSDGVPADELGQAALRAILDRAVAQGAVDELKERARDAIGEAGGRLLDRLTGD